jgi:uncharacterized peroxidase-related enzyme
MSTTPRFEADVQVSSEYSTPKGFPIHSPATAPEQSGPALEKLAAKLGMLPNLYAVMAESPAVLHSVLALGEQVGKSQLFSSDEKQIMQLAASYANDCVYCMAAHTASALRQGLAAEYVDALRNGRPLADSKLEALRVFTEQMTAQRGQMTSEQETAFHDAGFSRAQMLEVALNVAYKTLTNYADHLAQTPLDVHFEQFAWQLPQH